MINKRNFFKILSSAVLVTLTVGNFSNVWMIKKSKFSTENSRKQKIVEAIAEKIINKVKCNKNSASFYSKLLVNQIITLKNCKNSITTISILEKKLNLIADFAASAYPFYLYGAQTGNPYGCLGIDKIAKSIVYNFIKI